MLRAACRLPLYTQRENIGKPAYINGMHDFIEVTLVQDCCVHLL